MIVINIINDNGFSDLSIGVDGDWIIVVYK